MFIIQNKIGFLKRCAAYEIGKSNYRNTEIFSRLQCGALKLIDPQLECVLGPKRTLVGGTCTRHPLLAMDFCMMNLTCMLLLLLPYTGTAVSASVKKGLRMLINLPLPLF